MSSFLFPLFLREYNKEYLQGRKKLIAALKVLLLSPWQILIIWFLSPEISLSVQNKPWHYEGINNVLSFLFYPFLEISGPNLPPKVTHLSMGRVGKFSSLHSFIR